MRALLLVTLGALLVAGCHEDVCGGYGGKTCIALLVAAPPGPGESVDQIDLFDKSGFPLDATSPMSPGQPTPLPITLPVLPAAGYSGPYDILVTGLLGGVVVGQAEATGQITTGQHQRIEVTLGSINQTGDGGAGTDMAGGNICGQIACANNRLCNAAGCTSCDRIAGTCVK